MANIRQRYKNGFTLIEIIIVIAIIGILATVVGISYNGIQAGARDKSVLSDLDALDGIETSYGLKNNVAGKAWYSGSGVDSDLQFTPSDGNVIDVVTNSTDYCIRGYNPQSSTHKTLATAAIKESTAGVCTTLLASSGAVADSPTSGGLVLTELTSTGHDEWWGGVASSSDGSKLLAGSDCGTIVVSTNYGADWTFAFPDNCNYDWSGVGMSPDGTKMIAGSRYGELFASTDSGATWTERLGGPSNAWVSKFVFSGDGSKVVGVNRPSSSTGYIYKSSDLGASWTQLASAGNRKWGGVAISSDGTKLAATDSAVGGYIYTSTDSGSTWTAHTTGPTKMFSIVGSADGTKLVVANYGLMYMSNDSGSTWTQITSAGTHFFYSLAMSADGNIIFAGDDAATPGAYIYTSSDGGATWVQHTEVDDYWNGIALSADGTKMIAGVDAGYLHLGTYTP